ncbi:MAG TPA: HDIG domain-containing protein [Clostridiaceae bacterium]|nr:HDIG domain-containing protein [Clostridiaceae bacterium]
MNNKYTKRLVAVLGFILLCGLITFFIYQRALPMVYPLEVGSVSEYDIIATGDVVDQEATDNLAKQRSAQVEMVMSRSETISRNSLNRVERFFNAADQVRSNLFSAERTSQSQTETGEPLDTVYRLTESEIAQGVTQLRTVLEDNLGVVPADATLRTMIANERSIYESIKMRTISMADVIMQGKNDDLELRTQIERKVNDLMSTVNYYKDDYKAIQDILLSTLEANVVYDDAATVKAREAEYNQVQQNPVVIPKGTRLVNVGDIVDENTYQQLLALNLIDTGSVNVLYLLGISLLVLFCISGIVSYIYYFERERMLHTNDRLMTILILLVPLLIAGWLTKEYSIVSTAYIATILLTMYFNLRTGLVLSIFLTLLMSPISSSGGQFLFISAFGVLGIGMLTEIFTKDNRYVLFILGSALCCGFGTLTFDMIAKSGISIAGTNAGIVMLSGGLSAVVGTGLTPLVEIFLSSVSPMRLVELAQSNQPLLRKLFLDAPGTYQHCMMVANLAENAADSVGADSLLVRVGAYYHDIGKTVNPYMFTENQSGTNPHDQLTPQESCTIIIDHVKNGLEIARKHRLPLPIQRIIMEHHGNTTQMYFYEEARKLAEQTGEPEPDPEAFRYPWPLPSNKESAIVMLADSCEAAMKANGIDNSEQAEVLIRRIVKTKIDNDQMISSSLSFADVERIIQSFLRVYAGQFHKRVRYPSDKSDDQ